MEETVSHVVANYYALHIGIHRPFITSLRPSLTFDFHSLAICTNAARACVHLIDLSDRDEDCNAIGYEMQVSELGFNAGLVLTILDSGLYSRQLWYWYSMFGLEEKLESHSASLKT